MSHWITTWLRRRPPSPGLKHLDARPQTAKPPSRPMTGKYLLLYHCLHERYADTVVLTLAEIEDLLGFALPEQARLRPEWWTDTGPPAAQSDSWILAERTAVP